jgi:hypothetical protein
MFRARGITRSLRIWPLFILLLFVPLVSAQEIRIEDLVKEAAQNKNPDVFNDFYFKLRITERRVDKKGRVSEETRLSEVFFPSKFSEKKKTLNFILLEENGKPLSEKELNKQREKAVKDVEEIEKDAEKNPNSATDDKGGYFVLATARSSFLENREFVINPVTILQNSDFSYLRRETVEGRETLVLNFKPQTGAKFSKAETYLANTEGTIWIDAEDKRVVRIEGFPSGMLGRQASNSPDEREQNTAIFYQQTKVKEGFWFPLRAGINGAKNKDFFEGLRSDTMYEFSDYRRFRAEVLDSKVGN